MRKRAGIVIWTGIMIVALAAVWLFSTHQTTKEAATGYGQLKLELKNRAYSEDISLWEAEDGTYYCFLPAGWKEGELSFGNIGKEDSVIIGENTYESGADLNGSIEDRTSYTMQLQVDGNLLETKNIIFMESANLPTLFVTTATGNMDAIHFDKESKEAATITLIDENGKLLCSEELEYMKARGNSTFLEVDKKSYQIKLERDFSVLGMPEAKKWLLLANAIDNTLLRNQVILDYTATYTDIPAVEGKYVDLYLNGEYAGNYYLCEKIEVDANRLNITDLEAKNEAVNNTQEFETWDDYLSEYGTIKAVDGMKNPEDITGGYLVELSDRDEYPDIRSGFATDNGNYYCIISPENASVEQVEYICNLFNEMEAAMMQEDGINPQTGKHFSEYLDMDSWTSKHLIEEAFHNPDGDKGSCFFYKDIDSVSPLIQVGPVWDYDRAMGGYERVIEVDDPRQIGNFSKYAEYLMKHESVQEMVAEKFENEMLPFMEEELEPYIDKWVQYLDASAQMDGVRWPDNGGYYLERESHLDYIKLFLEEKTNFLKEVWLEDQMYHRVTFLDYGGNTCGQYTVKHGETLKETPITRNYSAIFTGWECVETGEDYSAHLPVLEDKTYQSKWLDIGLFLQNGYKAADIDADQVDLETMKKLVEEIEKARGETPQE